MFSVVLTTKTPSRSIIISLVRARMDRDATVENHCKGQLQINGPATRWLHRSF
jgi:hypothetical protein